jgi:phospholipid/cholesterol/gamma-HCH transport system permease protein
MADPAPPPLPFPWTLLRPVDRFGRFAGRVAATAVRGPWFPREMLAHATTVGYRCLGPVLVTMLPFGAVLGLQGMNIFATMGSERMMSGLVTLIIIRELAPVLASVLIAAQGGSSFAAELGAMRIKEEIDATEVMAVDPVAYHVVPRVGAMLIVTPALTILGALFGIAGGFLVAVLSYDQAPGVYMANIPMLTGLYDLLAATGKAVVYGLLIGLLSTWQGYRASGGAEGVGRAVNNTIVYAIVFLLVLNYALSSILFGWR